MIVVNASVIVKWFLPEPDADAAMAVLAGPEKLAAPALVRVEAAAAMTRKARLGELTPQDAQSACRLWFSALKNGVVTLSPDEEDMESAVSLAIEIKHPLQDCLYLAVAQRLDGLLLTADPKFTARARGVYENVKLLGSV